MSQCAQEQGDSNAIFGWSTRQRLAKLHVCEVCEAFERLEVIQYPAVLPFSKLNKLLLGYFDPKKVFGDNENK